MINTKQRISQQQWFFILVFINICVTPFTFTPVLYQILGISSWVAIVCAFLLSVWSIYVTIYLCDTFRYENVVQWSGRVLGKWLGKVYSLGVIVILYLWSILMLTVFIELILDSQLPYTSRFLILLFLLGAVLYLLILGLETWARVGEFFAILLLLTLIVMNVAQFKNITLGHLLPLQAHLEVFTTTDSLRIEVLASLFIFRGAFALYFLYPYIKVRKSFTLATLSGTLIAFVEILLAVMLPILIFGSTFIQKIAFPYHAALETVTFSFLPIDRISILAAIVWQLIIVYVLCISFFTTAEGIRTLFNLKKRNVTLVIVTIVTFLLALIPHEKQISSIILMYWSVAGLIFFTVIPTVMWIMLKWMEMD